MDVRRGDIVIVTLNPPKGSEQRGGARPYVVIQNDVGNKHTPTTIVAPFTTQDDSDDVYPFEVEVAVANTPLTDDSVVNLTQIRTVDVEARIRSNIGSIPDSKVDELGRAIRESLEL